MDGLIEGKVVFITGAGSRVGQAAALFARRDAKEAACDMASNLADDNLPADGGPTAIPETAGISAVFLA